MSTDYGLQPTWPEGTEPTDEQFLEWFMSLTTPDKLRLVQDMRKVSQYGAVCAVLDHEGQIEQLQGGLQRATEVMNDLKDQIPAGPRISITYDT